MLNNRIPNLKPEHLMILLCVLASGLIGCSASPELGQARIAQNQGQIEQAFDLYSTYLEKHSGNAKVRKAHALLGEQLTEQTRQNVEASLAASVPHTVPQLKTIITELEVKSRFDSKRKVLPEIIARIKKEITEIKHETESSGKQLLILLNNQNLVEAKDLYREMKFLNPDSSAFEQTDPVFSSHYSNLIKVYLAGIPPHQLGRAVIEERNYLRQLSIQEDSRQKLEQILETFLMEGLREQIAKDIQGKRYYSAFLSIHESEKEALFNDELKRIQREGGAFYLQQAKARARSKQYHRAYLEAVKGYEINPEHPGMFEIHRDSRDKVAPGLEQYIAVSAFGATQKNPDLGPQFSDAFISHLFRTLPYGVKILERQKIDLVMAERKRELKEISNMLNVDLIITGNVSLMEIDRQVHESKGTIRAKIGDSRQQNPAYTEWLKRKRGTPPPETVLLPVHENVQYNKGRVVVKGFSTVSARIFDARKGAIVYAQEFNARFNTMDEFQDGVPGTTLAEDPLDLPSDTEIIEILRNKIVQQLSEVFQKEFSKRKVAYVNEARHHIARKEITRAMEPLAQGLLYAVKSKLRPDDPEVIPLRDLIVEYTEKNFL